MDSACADTAEAAEVTPAIVTYGLGAVIGQSAEGFLSAHRAGLLQCIVVDNASDDDTVGMLRCDHTWSQLIVNHANMGFGRAGNIIGGFDPRLFLCFEESGLCRRASRAGWEVRASGLAHHIIASSKKGTGDLAGEGPGTWTFSW